MYVVCRGGRAVPVPAIAPRPPPPRRGAGPGAGRGARRPTGGGGLAVYAMEFSYESETLSETSVRCVIRDTYISYRLASHSVTERTKSARDSARATVRPCVAVPPSQRPPRTRGTARPRAGPGEVGPPHVARDRPVRIKTRMPQPAARSMHLPSIARRPLPASTCGTLPATPNSKPWSSLALALALALAPVALCRPFGDAHAQSASGALKLSAIEPLDRRGGGLGFVVPDE